VGGRIDALFNVAGVSGPADPAEIIGINFVGTRELTELLLERMRAGAAVVHTASIAASHYRRRRELVAGLLAAADRPSAARWCREHRARIGTGYAVSKDALVWYTLTRAVELAGRGVRMNCAAPGLTETPILEASRRSRGSAFLDSIPRPLGRTAEPGEQAAVLAFLNSGAAGYLTGQVIWVDGGYMAGVATGRFPNVTGDAGDAAGPEEPEGPAGPEQSEGPEQPGERS
jgi:NAD(P)-dependent dehydrogenase (short-subunit alcohol dehydrogenase family)